MATIASPRTQSPAPNRASSPSSTTPTSSVRPSIDLSTTSNTPSGTAPTQRRNRAALRDYYNLKSRPPTTTHQAPELIRTTSQTSTTSNTTTATASTSGPSHHNQQQQPAQQNSTSVLPPGIDDPSFDPQLYITTLLSNATLKDILRAESALVSEIRTLDGETKALVYDNYSKLIRAVSTIGEMQKGMKGSGSSSSGNSTVHGRGRGGTSSSSTSTSTSTNVPTKHAREGREEVAADTSTHTRTRTSTTTSTMSHTTNTTRDGPTDVHDLDSKLTRLFTLVNDMKSQSQPEEAPDRATMKADRSTRKQQDLVRWVLDAPHRLEALVQSGRQTEADDQWGDVLVCLGKWEGVAGVEEVRGGCERVMKGGLSEDRNGDGEGSVVGGEG